jgi:hypothetical protein
LLLRCEQILETCQVILGCILGHLIGVAESGQQVCQFGLLIDIEIDLQTSSDEVKFAHEDREVPSCAGTASAASAPAAAPSSAHAHPHAAHAHAHPHAATGGTTGASSCGGIVRRPGPVQYTPLMADGMHGKQHTAGSEHDS